jgi:hypothetical protein
MATNTWIVIQSVVTNVEMQSIAQISSMIYMVTIIVSTIIILVSLIQFVYLLANNNGLTWRYKKPFALLLVWIFLIPIVFIIMTFVNFLIGS